MKFRAEIVCANDEERAFFNKIEEQGETFYDTEAVYMQQPVEYAPFWIEQKHVETFPEKHIVIIHGASPNPVWQASRARVLVPRLDLATRFASYFLSTAGQERSSIHFDLSLNTGLYNKVAEIAFGLSGATLITMDDSGAPEYAKAKPLSFTRSLKYPGIGEQDLYKTLRETLLEWRVVE